MSQVLKTTDASGGVEWLIINDCAAFRVVDENFEILGSMKGRPTPIMPFGIFLGVIGILALEQLLTQRALLNSWGVWMSLLLFFTALGPFLGLRQVIQVDRRSLKIEVTSFIYSWKIKHRVLSSNGEIHAEPKRILGTWRIGLVRKGEWWAVPFVVGSLKQIEELAAQTNLFLKVGHKA